jgi:hypothetical protein
MSSPFAMERKTNGRPANGGPAHLRTHGSGHLPGQIGVSGLEFAPLLRGAAQIAML